MTNLLKHEIFPTLMPIAYMTFYLTFLSLYGEINESKTSKHVKCRGAGMPQLWAPSPPSNVPRCESRS